MITIFKDKKKKYNYESFDLKNKIKISFEVFPPKNIFLENQLFHSINILNKCHPEFFSVTNSVCINMRDKTFSVLKKMFSLTNVKLFAHFTTIGLNESLIKDIAYKYWNYGIKNIIALRGDLPSKYSEKIIYAVDLIKLLKSVNDFEILVAAYPELHPESHSLQEDLINLKNKVDLGVNTAITQFFFSVDKFLKFRDSCLRIGLKIDLIPGILPILNINQLKKFINMTNVYVPNWILDSFYQNSENINKCIDLSVNIAVDLIINLYHEGIKNFHLYTLNQSDLSFKICRKLGLI
ncbi:5,10-methylenetetrahydrofolate reductase [Buchnera aphidicola (Cinara piceae)]|uniref:Methylenetetrahydrofolate reductase n=1 Tax=Buchnera aphidicola (Cinara piceae) TaxID=1660043 RepID=A0A803FT98_9GAMM|nr:methylenetetrahydrofolate reductase [Buchnera aphidicola]VFP87823.1 5,10-methylenetetrahydrofolate reductase [Buchnera aphidicola (Cinara piceae)]